MTQIAIIQITGLKHALILTNLSIRIVLRVTAKFKLDVIDLNGAFLFF